MIKEGIGICKPTPVKVGLESADLKEARHIVKERDEYRGYSKSKDYWVRGMHIDGPLGGMLGEIAFCRWLNRICKPDQFAINREKLPKGDLGWDFDVYGEKIDAKAELRLRDESYLRRMDNSGRLFALRADVYVWICTMMDDTPVAMLHGWLFRADVRQLPRGHFKRAPGGRQHWNLVPRKRNLQSMGSLRDRILNNKDLQNGADSIPR